MRVRLLSLTLIVLWLSADSVAAEARLPSADKASADSTQPSAANDSEREVAQGVAAAVTREWTAAVVAALVSEGDADSLALAALISPMQAHAELHGVGTAEPDQALIDRVAEGGAALRAQALAKASQLSVPLLLALVSNDPQQSGADGEDATMGLEVDVEQAIHIDRLLERAPDDAAGWLLKVRQMQRMGEPSEAITRVLQEAARVVTGTRPWYFELARHFDRAFSLVPAPEGLAELTQELIRASGHDIQLVPNQTEEFLRMSMGLNLAITHGLSSWHSLTKACDKAAAADKARQPACLQLGRVLALHGKTLIDTRIGLLIWHRMVEGQDAAIGVVERKRASHWMGESYAELASAHESEKGLQQFFDHIRRPGADEMDYIRELLTEAGVSLQPPPQWLPSNPEMLTAR